MEYVTVILCLVPIIIQVVFIIKMWKYDDI